MPKFNVTLYPAIMIRFSAIEAETPVQAVEVAEALLRLTTFHGTNTEWAEITDDDRDITPCVDMLLPNGDVDEDQMDLLSTTGDDK